MGISSRVSSVLGSCVRNQSYVVQTLQSLFSMREECEMFTIGSTKSSFFLNLKFSLSLYFLICHLRVIHSSALDGISQCYRWERSTATSTVATTNNGVSTLGTMIKHHNCSNCVAFVSSFEHSIQHFPQSL